MSLGQLNVDDHHVLIRNVRVQKKKFITHTVRVKHQILIKFHLNTQVAYIRCIN